MEINYQSYTLEELQDVKRNVDRYKYPERYEAVVDEIAKRIIIQTRDQHEQKTSHSHNSAEVCDKPIREVDEEGNYIPNVVAVTDQIKNFSLAVALLLYGLFGLYRNDLYIPGRRGGVHLSDTPAILVFIAILLGCINLLTVIVDHHDTRDNEMSYYRFRKTTEYLGYAIFGVAAFYGLYR
ncbi:MAG: hypothetical protein V2I33_10140 [Kangiellaceae bacterium]|jgi:hypothetical protein|nr:hypothetical protein [Kangiellaceae bacterium]